MSPGIRAISSLIFSTVSGCAVRICMAAPPRKSMDILSLVGIQMNNARPNAIAMAEPPMAIFALFMNW